MVKPEEMQSQSQSQSQSLTTSTGGAVDIENSRIEGDAVGGGDGVDAAVTVNVSDLSSEKYSNNANNNTNLDALETLTLTSSTPIPIASTPTLMPDADTSPQIHTSASPARERKRLSSISNSVSKGLSIASQWTKQMLGNSTGVSERIEVQRAIQRIRTIQEEMKITLNLMRGVQQAEQRAVLQHSAFKQLIRDINDRGSGAESTALSDSADAPSTSSAPVEKIDHPIVDSMTKALTYRLAQSDAMSSLIQSLSLLLTTDIAYAQKLVSQLNIDRLHVDACREKVKSFEGVTTENESEAQKKNKESADEKLRKAYEEHSQTVSLFMECVSEIEARRNVIYSTEIIQFITYAKDQYTEASEFLQSQKQQASASTT